MSDKTNPFLTTPQAASASALSPDALSQARQVPGAPSSPFTEMILARTAIALPAPAGQGNGPKGYSTGRVTDRGKGLPGGGSSPTAAPHRPSGSFFPGSGLYSPPSFPPGAGYPPAPGAGTAPSDGPYLLFSADARLTAAEVFHLVIPGASPPADTSRIWLDTSTTPGVPKFYTGSAWQSLQGAAGLAGAAGSGSGSAIFNGSGPPASGTGATGDYYFDTSASNVYQKGTSGWGSTLFNIKGVPGADGLSSQILNGTTAPASSDTRGGPGDYLLVTSGADLGKLYQKDATTGWGLLVNLRGPQGIPGPTGPPGPAGTGGGGGSGYNTQLVIPGHPVHWPQHGGWFSYEMDVSAYGHFTDLGYIPTLVSTLSGVQINPNFSRFGNLYVGWTIYVPPSLAPSTGGVADGLYGIVYCNYSGTYPNVSASQDFTYIGPTLLV